jgi:type I restriction enzyme S subunit
MSEWKEYKLGTLIKSISKTYKFSDEKVCFLNTSDTLEGKVINHNYFDPLDLPGQAKKSIELNDILYSEIRPANKRYAFVDFNVKKYVVSTKLMVLRIINSEVITPKYLFYFLTSDEIVQLLQTLAEGRSGTFPQIRFEEISLLDIKLPPIDIQNSIVELISSLDDKIELNNKINHELEDLAQTLFKRWFIDFEFPNENGDPYKSSGGEMVDSELGEIPKGWGVNTILNEFNINMGQSPKGETYNVNGEGITFFQGRSDFGLRFPTERIYTTAPKKIAEKFETLLSVRAPVGDINMAEKRCCIGRGLSSISHPENYYSYTYYKIRSIQGDLKSYDNEGTVFGSINKVTLGNIKTIQSPIFLTYQYNELVTENDKLIFNLTNQIKELTTLRDTLLPKLISGELEVSQIQNLP